MTFSVSSAVEVSAALDGKSSEQSNVCKVCNCCTEVHMVDKHGIRVICILSP